MRFSRSTHLLMFLSLETLTSIIRTGLPILVELIDLVNSVIIFLSQMTLLRWLTFLLGSQTDSHSATLLDLFLSSDTSICSSMVFHPLRNSDHVVVSVSMDFPISSKYDAMFHYMAYDYSRADWDGLCNHLRDGKISLNAVLLLLLNFGSKFRLGLISISSLIVSIRLNLTHLHGFQ